MRKIILPVAVIFFLFLLIKLPNVGIRLSDSNIYFYSAYQLFLGKMLYKDIFFTNFPLFPYISVLYFLILGKNLALYYITPLIEVLLVSIVIAKIIYTETKNTFLTIVSICSYLFSFIILTTTDHQTGVFIASLFAIVSYYSYTKNRFFFSGFFIGLTLMTKAYFLPVFLALVLTMIVKRQKKTVGFLISFLITILLVLSPSFLYARGELITDIINYSLVRTQGISKENILWFFVQHDLLLTSCFVYSLATIKKRPFFGFLSLFGILFILFYKDIYYLYLNFFVPFLVLTIPSLLMGIQKKFLVQKFVLPTIIFIACIYNIALYTTTYRTLQKIDNMDDLVKKITSEHPDFLYGINAITPAFAYLSNTPLLKNIVDTNDNIYRKGFLHANRLTSEALKKKTIFIALGASYPQQNIAVDIVSEVIDKKQLQRMHCRLLTSYPVVTEGLENRLNIISCF